MQKLVLARSVRSDMGKTMVDLVAAASDTQNDFQSGDRDGVMRIDIYGAQSLFAEGKTYVIDISDPSETVVTETPIIQLNAAQAPQPASFKFAGTLQIDTDGDVVTGISILPPAEPGANPGPSGESEAAATNTQDNTPAVAEAEQSGGEASGDIPTPGGVVSDAANNGGESTGTGNADPAIPPQSAGGASTADNSEAGGTTANPAASA